jgi:hypothetical protein
MALLKILFQFHLECKGKPPETSVRIKRSAGNSYVQVQSILLHYAVWRIFLFLLKK